jgi:hypothetical protein
MKKKKVSDMTREEFIYHKKKLKEKRLLAEIERTERFVTVVGKWYRYFKAKYKILKKNNPKLRYDKKIDWRKEPICQEDFAMWDEDEMREFLFYCDYFAYREDFFIEFYCLDGWEYHLLKLKEKLRKFYDEEL